MFLCVLTSLPTDEYPDDSPHKFTANLPCTLHLNEKWEVSLIGISVPKLSNSYLKSREFDTNDRLAHIRIPETTNEEDVNELNDENGELPSLIARHPFEIPLRHGDSGRDIVEKYLRPSLNQYGVKAFVNKNGHCQLQGVKGHTISFSPLIRRLLGWPENDQFISIESNDGILIGPNPVVINPPAFFHVECDAVVNSIINSMFIKLLQSNFQFDDNEKYSTFKVTNQVWLPLASQQVYSISFNIIDEHLLPISFERGLTYITLQFRIGK